LCLAANSELTTEAQRTQGRSKRDHFVVAFSVLSVPLW
jgi:hypothetical protein